MSILIQHIEKAYQGCESKTALVINQQAYSFAELMDKVNAVSHNLHTLGIKPGHKVVVSLPNGLEFVVIMLAIAKLNAVLVPVPLAINANAFFTACNNTQAKHVISWHHSLVSYQKTCSQREYQISNWFSVGKQLESAKSFEDCYQDIDQTIDFPQSPADSPYILTMTSGSTGAPKPIVLSQQTKITRAQSAIDIYHITDKDITLVGTPLYHSLAERLVLLSLLSGGTAVLMAKFTIASWLDLIAQYKVTFTIAVSSQLKQLIGYSNLPDLSSLRCLVSSSALLELPDKQQLIKLLNCEFHECYGASEIAIASNIRFSTKNPANSVGKALDNTELVILDDSREPVPCGEVGEIACKTPMIFSGYYNQPEATASSFSHDFFCTGDLGKLDQDGFLYFVGRKKESIITGGINVYPFDIETRLKTLPQLESVVAFALADQLLGEVVALAIVVTNSADADAVIDNIRIDCAINLDSYQQPRKYFVFDKLPHNALGKIDKLQIKALANKQASADQTRYYIQEQVNA